MVVDDEPDLADAVAGSLRREGYAVDVSNNGQDALERLSINPYDLVLLDLAMPNMSGVEVFSSLKELKPESRVIFMTGYSKDEFSDLLSDNEATTSVLSKPFPMQELKVSVESMLAR